MTPHYINLSTTSLLRLVFLLFILTPILFPGCKKEKEKEKIPEVNLSEILVSSGKIVPPNGIQMSSWEIVSPISDGKITGDEFSVEVFGGHYNTTMVLNKEGNVVMMGLNAPGEKSKDITVESTALGLLMHSPFLVFLTPEGKTKFIANIKSSTLFTALKSEIQEVIINKGNLFDRQNKDLIKKLEAILTSPAVQLSLKANKGVLEHMQILEDRDLMKDKKPEEFYRSNNAMAKGFMAAPSKTSIHDAPALMAKSGTTLTFSNPGTNIYATSVGVYKDAKLDKVITIEGVDAFPGSIVEILEGKVGSYLGERSPVLQNYEMAADGTYEIKMRTGRPGAMENSEQYQKALQENLINIMSYSVSTIFPGANADELKCMLGTFRTILRDLNVVDYKDPYAATFDVFKMVYDHYDSLLGCYKAEGPNSKYLKGLSKLFDLYELFGNTANLTAYGIQWAVAEPRFDTCFVVKAQTVTKCCEVISDGFFTDARDGQQYEYKKIGNQTWMIENLNYVIPNSGAAQLDRPDLRLGRLYGPEELDQIAPKGWHVPDNEEWEELIAHLGGAGPATLKMKDRCQKLWGDDPAISNSSMFTWYPVGMITHNLIFDPSRTGIWSTSSARRTEDIQYFYYGLFSDQDIVQGYCTNYSSVTLPVRCVKD